MGRITSFLFGVVVGAALFYTAIHFHVVRGSDGFHLIHKIEARLPEAYVDVRGFGVTEWANHPQLAAAVMQAEKQQLLGEAAGVSLQQGVNQVLEGWPTQ